MSSLLCLIVFVVVLKTWFVLVFLFVFVVVLRTCSKSLGSAIVSSTTTRLVEGSIFDTLSLSGEHCLRFYISTISSHFFLFFLSEEHCLSFCIWTRFILCFSYLFLTHCRYLRSIVLIFSFWQDSFMFFLSIKIDVCLTRYCFWKGQLLHGVHRL